MGKSISYFKKTQRRNKEERNFDHQSTVSNRVDGACKFRF